MSSIGKKFKNKIPLYTNLPNNIIKSWKKKITKRVIFGNNIFYAIIQNKKNLWNMIK